jgi:hypothetical protein
MITDLFMIIPNFPMAAYNSFHGKWMFQQHGKCRIIKTYWNQFNYLYLPGCNFYGFFGSLSGFVNISTLVLISIDRCLAIKNPFQVLNPQRKRIFSKL